MTTSKIRSWSARPTCRLYSVLCLTIVLLAPACTGNVVPLENAFPPELENIQLGISSAAILAKINKVGKYTFGPIAEFENRKRINWLPPNSPHYTSISFDFTRKDRLYNIRFALRRDLQRKKSNLRKIFLSRLGIEGNAVKVTRPGKELEIYANENSPVQFIEYMDLNDKQLYFEMFNRAISVADRPPWKIPNVLKNKPEQKKKLEPEKEKTKEQNN